MVSARQRMTMRATIERNAGTEDAYGNPRTDWQIVGIEVPCYVWAARGGGRRTRIGDQDQITLDLPGAIFPLATDVDHKDRLLTVVDRRGEELFAMMYVDAVLRRRDHLQVSLREYS